MRHAPLFFAAATLVLSAAASAQPDPCSGQDDALRAQSSRYAVRFRTLPQPAVGRHFAVVFAVCAAAGAVEPDSVRVDARMPSHGHGMNYRPTVTALGDGRYRAEGLLFHMPGQWELIFVVRGAGASEHIRHTLVLQ